MPSRAQARSRKRCTTTPPTLLDRLQSYSTGDTPFLELYDAIYTIAHSPDVTGSSDATLAAAVATAQANLSGLRAVGFSNSSSSAVSIIAEPIIITGVPDDPPGDHDRP